MGSSEKKSNPDGLSSKELVAAERLAKLMFRDIKYEHSVVSKLSSSFGEIPRELIPCNYGYGISTDIVPNHRFLEPVLQMLEDIKEGRLILSEKKDSDG